MRAGNLGLEDLDGHVVEVAGQGPDHAVLAVAAAGGAPSADVGFVVEEQFVGAGVDAGELEHLPVAGVSSFRSMPGPERLRNGVPCRRWRSLRDRSSPVQAGGGPTNLYLDRDNVSAAPP